MKRKINKRNRPAFKNILFVSALAVMAAATLWQAGSIVKKQKEAQKLAKEQEKLDNSCKIIKEIRENTIDKIINE